MIASPRFFSITTQMLLVLKSMVLDFEVVSTVSVVGFSVINCYHASLSFSMCMLNNNNTPFEYVAF